MNRNEDRSSPQTAKMNRERLAVERAPVIDEEANKAIAVRQNMARLRALRQAKEAQEVQSEIAKAAKPKSKKRFR